MTSQPDSLRVHRVQGAANSVVAGRVVYAPVKSLWFSAMACAAVVGGAWTFTWPAFLLFLGLTGIVLLFGHSLGSHRKLIHNAFQCPRWLERVLVYCGVQVGLAGPIGLLRQHELRDYAQRLPDCHPYLRHGSSPLRDAWWQLHCELQLKSPPRLRLEPRITNDRFLEILERSWMVQQVPPALLLYAFGGWAFVFWGVCARVTAGVFGHWLIGYFAHNHGGMHHEVAGAAVQGRNIQFTSLLTMGESWHNNHHAFPGSARLGLLPGEWDPGWWALMMLRKLGLVWQIRLPADLPERPELIALASMATASRATPVAARMSLGSLLRSCVTGSRRLHRRPLLQGPAATFPVGLYRWMAGSRAVFALDRSQPRLTLTSTDGQLHGLPAVCVLIAMRGRSGLVCALLVAPVAWIVESTRESFSQA